MNSLFLDLASNKGFIACVTDDAVVASKPVDHRLGDHELVPAVEKLLKDAGWNYKDLTGVACVLGPGGFTSLRVAVAFANTLAWSVKIPSAGVHLSDLYVVRFPPPPPQPPSPEGRGGSTGSVWVHSTKKTELFIRGFGSLAKIFPEAVCIKLEEFREKIPEGTAWMGELIEEHRKVADERKMEPIELQSIEKILPAFLQTLSYENKTLEPWYGRSW